MIDKSKKYWTSDTAEDIAEYLRLYSENNNIDAVNGSACTVHHDH